MDPYRSVAPDARAEAPRDPGIVGDIISQFADPLAFYRELVQNSIDAGTDRVEVRIEHDASASLVRVAVRDRGEGMTRDILENQLLVLFRSTKEKDRSKIGKFGIGFASVLAPDPELVSVSTARDGRRLVLHLHRDLTYQLFDGGPATQTGTVVELDLAIAAGDVAGFVERSVAALERWCRHASVPIELVAHVADQPELRRRIDRPLALDGALVEVRMRADADQLEAVAGLHAPATPYTGFFNHGLMLYETTEPLLGNVSVKLQDARLGHTLSRDNVRRDRHFERALELARSLVERQLPAAAAAALRAAAEAGDHARWHELVAALADAKLALPARAWWFPLVVPLGEQRAIEASALGKRAWTSHEAGPIVELLVARGEPVLHAAIGEQPALRALVEELAGCELRAVQSELTRVVCEPLADADEVLVSRLGSLCELVYRRPSAIRVGRFDGAHADLLSLAGAPGTDDASELLVDSAQALANPFGKKRVPLVLSAAHPTYQAARAADPRLGASLLLRILLLQHRLLDVARSTTLLEHALDEIDAGGSGR